MVPIRLTYWFTTRGVSRCPIESRHGVDPAMTVAGPRLPRDPARITASPPFQQLCQLVP